MSERINIPFTNEHFAAFCEKMLGQPYWYGSCAYKATAALLNRKSRQYPSHYGSARTARYQQDIRNRAVVCDCIGGLKGYCWTGGGQSALEAIGTDKAVASRYGANGCPDKGANGMFSYAKSKGMAWGTMVTPAGCDRAGAVPGRARGLHRRRRLCGGVAGLCLRLRQNQDRRERLDPLVPDSLSGLWERRV